MPLTRRLALTALAALLGGSRGALAVCSKTLTGPTCSAASIVSDASCCGAASCNLNGTITINAPICDLDFAGRNVTLSGTLVVGPNTVTIEAGSVEVSGLLDASGHVSPDPAGNVTITAGGGLNLTGGAGSGINVSGFGAGGGTLTVNTGGPVFLSGGSVTANGLDTDSNGGSISITSSTCPPPPNSCVTIGVQVQANSMIGVNTFAFGGSVTLEAPGDFTISDSGRIQALGGSGDGGTILLMSAGKVSMTTGAQLQANALGTSAGSGGTVEIDAASMSILGIIEAKGGTDVTDGLGGDGGIVSLEAFTGPLVLMRSTSGISADGAGGGNGGDVSLTTDSP